MVFASQKFILPAWLLQGIWLPPSSVKMETDQKSGTKKDDFFLIEQQ